MPMASSYDDCFLLSIGWSEYSDICSQVFSNRIVLTVH
jgi:hypothetical protein